MSLRGTIVDTNGLVSEGSGENIFVVDREVLYTPPVGASILLGLEVREQSIPREMLCVADEAFFNGAAVEISPIRSVDKVRVGDGSPGPMTARIQDAFYAIVQGKTPDRHGWLTLVDSR